MCEYGRLVRDTAARTFLRDAASSSRWDCEARCEADICCGSFAWVVEISRRGMKQGEPPPTSTSTRLAVEMAGTVSCDASGSSTCASSLCSGGLSSQLGHQASSSKWYSPVSSAEWCTLGPG